MNHSSLLKVSLFAGILSTLALVQTYALSSQSSAQRFTLYRFELACFGSIAVAPGTKYIWKRIGKDLLGDKSPTPFQIFFKCFVAVIIGLAHAFPLTILRIVKEPIFNVFSWLACGVITAVLFFYGTLTLLMHIIKRYFLRSFELSNRSITLVSLILSLLSIWTAYGIATNSPTVIRVEIPMPKLPHSMDKLHIVLLSDIHVGPTVGIKMLNRLVQMTNNLQPDMVILAGDLTDITADNGKFMTYPLKDLNAPLGKYFVTGNHEYHTGDMDNWFLLMEKYGFNVLHNSNKKIYSKVKSGDWLCLMGTDDYEASRFGFEGHGMDLAKAYAGCDSNHANILVAHQPKAAKLALDSKYSIQLVLSGHTHAGQIFPLSIPVYLLNPFFHGLYKYKESHVYVSQGCAYFGIPVRLFSHPEITEIFLRSVI